MGNDNQNVLYGKKSIFNKRKDEIFVAYNEREMLSDNGHILGFLGSLMYYAGICDCETI